MDCLSLGSRRVRRSTGLFKMSKFIYFPSFSAGAMGNSLEKNVKLIFTVDCGTLSFDAIDYAKNNGVDVIVLDHHQSEVKLPKAFSIINPNRLDDKSDLQYLCAAGVCFMFLVSLNRSFRSIKWFNQNNM